MLVLTRKPKEEIRIGNGITITILRVKGQSVRIGIDAPNDVRIVRGELKPEVQEPVKTNKVAPTASDSSPVRSRSKATVDNRQRCEKLVGLSKSEQPMPPCSTRLPGASRSSTLKALVARNRKSPSVSPTVSGSGPPS